MTSSSAAGTNNRVVVVAVDESDNADMAFKCKSIVEIS